MLDDQYPPRQFYGLKPREFDAVNAKSEAAPIDVQELFRTAANGGANPTPKPGAQPAARNDVHDILRDNIERATAAGLNELKAKPRRPSRRKREYWTLMAVGNAFFVYNAIIGRDNVWTFVHSVAGVGLFSAGLTWIMWQVMDDY